MMLEVRRALEPDLKVLEFTAPLPPSVNDYLGKRVIYKFGKPIVQLYETDKAKKYKRLVANTVNRAVAEVGWVNAGEYDYVICEVDVFLSQKRRDADNIFKCLLDGINATECIYDDSMVIPRVCDIQIDKDNPRVVVRMYKSEKLGLFPNEEIYRVFINNYCEKCKRFNKNCSLLRKTKENRVTVEVTNQGCSFGCSAFSYKKGQ